MKTTALCTASILLLSCSSNTTRTKHPSDPRPSLADPSSLSPNETNATTGSVAEETTDGFLPEVTPTPVVEPEPTVTPAPTPTPLPPAPSVDWNVNGQAIASGTACRSFGDTPDAFFISAGNEFSLVMNRLALNLDSQTATLAERQACTIRVPVRLAKGFFISKMVHSISLAVEKSAGTSGSLALKTSLFSDLTAAAEQSLAYGETSRGGIVALTAAAKLTDSTETFCAATEDTAGMFGMNIAMSGQRDSSAEVLRVTPIDGQTIRLSQGIEIHPCLR